VTETKNHLIAKRVKICKGNFRDPTVGNVDDASMSILNGLLFKAETLQRVAPYPRLIRRDPCNKLELSDLPNLPPDVQAIDQWYEDVANNGMDDGKGEDLKPAADRKTGENLAFEENIMKGNIEVKSCNLDNKVQIIQSNNKQRQNNVSSLDDIVSILTQDQALITIVEDAFKSLMSRSVNSNNEQDLYKSHEDDEIHSDEEDRKPPARLNVGVKDDGFRSEPRENIITNTVKNATHDAVRSIILSSEKVAEFVAEWQIEQVNNVSFTVSAGMKSKASSSRGGATSTTQALSSASSAAGELGASSAPPVKSVSFSSVSAPLHFLDDEERDIGERDQATNPVSNEIFEEPVDFSRRHRGRRGDGSLGTELDATGGFNGRSRTKSASPPPPAFPLLLQEQMYVPRGRRTMSPQTFSDTGESTASGNSSVSSTHHANISNAVTPTEPLDLSNHQHQPQVHFSAMNPNPQLILEASTVNNINNSGCIISNEISGTQHNPRVTFTETSQARDGGRSVSFDNSDPENRTSPRVSSSRGSRSGLSSPSIEPAPSPPLQSSRSSTTHIQFRLNPIETITEAAARLSALHNENVTDGENVDLSTNNRSSTRVVHFSAMRGTVAVPINATNETLDNNLHDNSTNETIENNLIDNSLEGQSLGVHLTLPQTTSSSVRFAEEESDYHHNGANFITGEANNNQHNARVTFTESLTAGDDSRSSSSEHRFPSSNHSEVEIASVADRLRRLIRRTEAVNNVTLEAAFAHFDNDNSGTITARELQRGLGDFGESFSFTLEECSALLACLAGEQYRNEGSNRSRGAHQEGINLLEFYRAMGRQSPPPTLEFPLDTDAENTDNDTRSSIVRPLAIQTNSSVQRRSPPPESSSPPPKFISKCRNDESENDIVGNNFFNSELVDSMKNSDDENMNQAIAGNEQSLPHNLRDTVIEGEGDAKMSACSSSTKKNESSNNESKENAKIPARTTHPSKHPEAQDNGEVITCLTEEGHMHHRVNISEGFFSDNNATDFDPPGISQSLSGQSGCSESVTATHDSIEIDVGEEIISREREVINILSPINASESFENGDVRGRAPSENHDSENNIDAMRTGSAILDNGRRVTFANAVVSEVRERPRTIPEDLKSLFYSASDIDE